MLSAIMLFGVQSHTTHDATLREELGSIVYAANYGMYRNTHPTPSELLLLAKKSDPAIISPSHR